MRVSCRLTEVLELLVFLWRNGTLGEELLDILPSESGHGRRSTDSDPSAGQGVAEQPEKPRREPAESPPIRVLSPLIGLDRVAEPVRQMDGFDLLQPRNSRG